MKTYIANISEYHTNLLVSFHKLAHILSILLTLPFYVYVTYDTGRNYEKETVVDVMPLNPKVTGLTVFDGCDTFCLICLVFRYTFD